jgi:ATP-dependent DNA helicase RecG
MSEMIGKLVSALSNAARIEDQALAYILWGIDNDSHDVVGTSFDFRTKKVGNQEFELWLAGMLRPNLAVSFRMVDHPGGKVVLCEVPSATNAPIEFKGTAYVRIGSATPKLSDHTDRYQKLIHNLRPFVWEKGIAKAYIDADEVLKLLDYPKYFSLTEQPLPDGKASILERLEADNLIAKDVGGAWNITNLGAILFANDMTAFDVSLARKAVRFVAYAGKSKADTVTHRLDGKRGYASGFEGLVADTSPVRVAPCEGALALRLRRRSAGAHSGVMRATWLPSRRVAICGHAGSKSGLRTCDTYSRLQVDLSRSPSPERMSHSEEARFQRQ